MAFYTNPDDEEKNEQGMNGQPAQPTEQQAPQLSGAIATGAASQTAPTAGPNAKASSGQTGFQNYQKANVGTATNRLNSAATQNVSNQAQTAKTGINQATQQFGAKVDAGSLANRGNALQDVKNVVDAARNIQVPNQAPIKATDGNPTIIGSQPVKTTNSGLVQEKTGTPNFGKNTNSAQAGLAQEQTSVPDFTKPAPTNNAPASLNPDQTSRFQEVINAKYQGPESLRQSGLYQQASGKVDTAQTALDNTKTAQGREALLKSIFGQTGANYSQGLNKLDAGILNASQSGVAGLQQAAKNAGNIQQQLDQAQIGSANLAQNRTNEINDIRNQSRQAFTEGKTAEEAATESRLGGVLENWDKLPNYFKDIIRNKTTDNAANMAKIEADYRAANPFDQAGYDSAQSNLNKIMAQIGTAYARGQDISKLTEQYNAAEKVANEQKAQKSTYENQVKSIAGNKDAVYLNPAEAAMLGIQSGEGFYNLGADAIGTGVADKNRLVSRNEQARQAALASLGGLDSSGQLSTNLRYNNADLAGTQTAADALDLDKTRANLNSAEQNFQDYAEGADLVGHGSKKNKTSGKTYYATEKANLGDILQNAGYDFDQLGNGVSNRDALNAALRVSSGQAPGVGQDLGQINPDLSGETIGNALQPYTDNSNLATKAGYTAADYGSFGITAGLRALGLDSVGALMGGVDTLTNAAGVGSVFGGSSSRQSKNKAADSARKDLKKQVDSSLNTQGFQNRASVVDSDATNSRLAALQELLKNIDKTNS